MTGAAGGRRKTPFVSLPVRIVEAAICGDALLMGALLSQRPDPHSDEPLALQLAARNGHADVIRILIPFSQPSFDNSIALVLAAEYGHVDCLALLMSVSFEQRQLFRALCRALLHGHAECARILLPIANPQPQAQDLLGLAMTGSPSCVATLLAHPGVRPLCRLDEAMAAAQLIPSQQASITALAALIEQESLADAARAGAGLAGSRPKRI